jgi:molecular chaperone GrpE
MPEEPTVDIPERKNAPDAPVPANPEPATASSPEEDWATRYKYLLADFENFRRRTERERESISRQARGAMLRELLPILEAFRAARGATDHLPPGDPVRHGLDLLDREWNTFLKHEGVAPVATVGEPFRSTEQEAVGEAPVREGVPSGAVAEVVQQGYRYFGGVLRPAKVVVARGDPDPPAPSDPSTPVEGS